MEIIPREEFKLECIDVGHQIITTVQESGAISDDKISDLFDPLYNSVKQRTQDAIQDSLDELRGELEDRDESDALDKILSERKAAITESTWMKLDAGCGTMNRNVCNGYLPKKNTEHFQFSIVNSKRDVDDIEDDELIQYSESHKHWNKYKTIYHTKITCPLMLKLYVNLINFHCEKSYDMDLSSPALLNALTELGETGIYMGCNYTSLLQLLRAYKAVVHSTCQLSIKSGPRKGSVCNRPVHTKSKCRYHYYAGLNI